MAGPHASATFRALGTTAVVAVDRPELLDAARALLEEHLRAIDETCSRFRADSELVRLAARAGRPVAISPLLADALETSLRVARLTGGLIVPTLGLSLVLAGYDADHATLAPTDAAPIFRPAGDWRALVVDRAAGTATVPAGVLLDLGATAKALAADRAAEEITRALGCGALVVLGGDLRCAGPVPAGGWAVLVDDAHDAIGPTAQAIRVHDGAVATSSTARRRWSRAGASLHHVLDPRSGRPADGPWRTASVAAATCVDANAASCAALLLGDAAPAWLAERGLPARLVARDGAVTTLAGWPDDVRDAATPALLEAAR